MAADELPLAHRDTLVLLPSRDCPVGCAFCCVPPDGHTLTPAVCEDLVEQAAEIPGLDVVAITGGEPFAWLDRYQGVLVACHRHGLPIKLVTSAGWAADPATARARLTPLVDLGLAQLTVSADPDHQRQVPVAFAECAVRVALALGLQVHVAGVFRTIEETVEAHLELPEHDRLTTARFVVQPFGRARDWELSQEGYGYHEDLADWGCTTPVRQDVTVFPTGDVYPCCAPAVEVSGLRVGSIHTEPLTTLVARIRDRFLLQVLKRRGFGYLYGLLATLDPELHARLPDPASHVSACSLCAAIFSAPELAERITAALDRHQLDLAHDLLAGD